VKTGERTQVQEVRSGGGYLSQSDLRLHFGLGQAEAVDQITVIWPGGQKQSLTNVRANQVQPIRQER
jgi:hypothetical protein